MPVGAAKVPLQASVSACVAVPPCFTAPSLAACTTACAWNSTSACQNMFQYSKRASAGARVRAYLTQRSCVFEIDVNVAATGTLALG